MSVLKAVSDCSSYKKLVPFHANIGTVSRRFIHAIIHASVVGQSLVIWRLWSLVIICRNLVRMTIDN